MHARIALIGDNSIEYIDKLINIWNSGDCAVLIDWRIPFPKAIEMMQEANVSSCYVDSRFLNTEEDKLIVSYSNIEFILYDSNMHNAAVLLPDSIYKKFNANDSNNEAVIIYSSGTTGNEKGVILSHYAIHTNADSIIDYMKPNDNDCLYIVKTISHSSTITGELLVALKSKMKLVIAPIIVPPRVILRNIEKFRTTILCLNPMLLSLISDEIDRKAYDFSSIRTIYISGSILSDKTYEKAHRVFKDIPIFNVYGLTEAGPRVTAQREDCCRSNSVGKPIKDVEVSIIGETGMPVAKGERGIVHVNTKSRYSGYVSGKEKFHSMYHDWLNSGDIGYFDYNDELHIVGRIDDVIIIDAHKIYPGDIEQAILRDEDISDCCVCSFPYDGADILACLYVSEDDCSDQIKRSLRQSLMQHEVPKRFVRIDSIPYNNRGKIDRLEASRILKETVLM